MDHERKCAVRLAVTTAAQKATARRLPYDLAMTEAIIAGIIAAEGGTPEVTGVVELKVMPAAPRLIRRAVEAFAHLMERQLKANDHKPGWPNDDPHDLFRRLLEEEGELMAEINRAGMKGQNLNPEVIASIGKEAADVANCAMMIAERYGALRDVQIPFVAEERN